MADEEGIPSWMFIQSKKIIEFSMYNGLNSNYLSLSDNCREVLPLQKMQRCHCLLLKSVYDLNGLEVVRADWTTFEEAPQILKEAQGDTVMG